MYIFVHQDYKKLKNNLYQSRVWPLVNMCAIWSFITPLTNQILKNNLCHEGKPMFFHVQKLVVAMTQS